MRGVDVNVNLGMISFVILGLTVGFYILVKHGLRRDSYATPSSFIIISKLGARGGSVLLSKVYRP